MAKTHKKMIAVIFAGGVGSRMWPLSRKSSPKQFEPIVGNKSTLQLAVDRLRPEYDWKDIYISTGEVYREIITTQLPKIPPGNIVGEPVMRDVGPAVGYMMSIVAKSHPHTPTAILWSDHLIEKVTEYKKALQSGGEYLSKNPNKIVFIGHKPRFANQNLGWIEFGNVVDQINQTSFHQFKKLHYRPSPKVAKQYFHSGHHAWNLGYWIVMPEFILEKFKQFEPKMHSQLIKLQSSYGSRNHQNDLNTIYPKLEKIHFDNAIMEKIDPNEAVVISTDLNWSDIGTWEALKEALQKKPEENLTKGNVSTSDTKNSVIYNYTNQMIAGIDLKDMVVVATDDVILVTPQESIPKIKKMLKTFEGTDKEKYT